MCVCVAVLSIIIIIIIKRRFCSCPRHLNISLLLFCLQRPQLFEGAIEPNDLCQGAVGDCWLVAAFACASEFPHVIRRMFQTREYNSRGKYRVKIYDPQAEKFVIVTVDDRIPCQKGTRRPMFMSPNGNELWAIILEKAYAKFCGSYHNLSGGFTLWGWQSMTGDKGACVYVCRTRVSICLCRFVVISLTMF